MKNEDGKANNNAILHLKSMGWTNLCKITHLTRSKVRGQNADNISTPRTRALRKNQGEIAR